MDRSRIVAWMTLASAIIAAGVLLRSRFRPIWDDPTERVIYEMSTAIALSSMLGSLPRLFRLESDLLRYGADAFSIVVAIIAFVSLRRLIRLTAQPPSVS